MLGQNVEAARARQHGILRPFLGRLQRGAAFEHLEAVAGHEKGFRGFVEPVIGAADALDEAAGAFGCADVDDEVDVAPVDAEVEGRGCNDGLELACGHGSFDFLPLRGRERTVMQRDGERFFVGAPEFLKHQFRLHARVDEDEGEAMRGDGAVDFRAWRSARYARPGHVFGGFEDADARLGAARDRDEVGKCDLGLRLV